MPNDELPPSAPPAASRAARPDWYWSAPYIAVLIFALAMLVLVWVLQRQEGETQRNALARDVQWAEQTMRLHMQGTEDFLGQLARELAADLLDGVVHHAHRQFDLHQSIQKRMIYTHQ